MKELLVLLGITLVVGLFALTGCKSVMIPDTEWCGDMGPDGATCVHTLSSATRDIAKPQWDIEREGMLCTQSSSFAAWKVIIEQLCHESSDCNYQQVTAFLDKTQTMGVKKYANPTVTVGPLH